ncbi:putative protein N(5)-glutamine methyltransferase [Kitasatospora sp. NPDC004240]
MSIFSSSRLRSSVVARLRAAGCVFAEDEARLILSTARTPAELAAMVDRRAAGLPLEHVLGWAEFCGLRIAVDPGVFVPRRRTEFLVSEAAALLGGPAAPDAPGGPATPDAVAVDLCCGSGALGAALAAAAPGPLELHAADLDPAAVACARRNLDGVAAGVHLGDLYEPLPDGLRGRVDVLLANVPYVPTEEVALLPAEAREHESPLALDGGADGLDVLRAVAARAPRWLAPGGSLLFETSERQVPDALAVVTGAGLTARVAECEELYATVVVATRPGGTG